MEKETFSTHLMRRDSMCWWGKRWLRSGFAIIAIKHMLSVKAPEIALVGQQVTISVTERYTSEPVAMAGVWAIDMNDIVVDVEDAEVFASLAESLGEFLGWTDNTGNVYHASMRQAICAGGGEG